MTMRPKVGTSPRGVEWGSKNRAQVGHDDRATSRAHTISLRDKGSVVCDSGARPRDVHSPVSMYAKSVFWTKKLT